MLYSRGSAIAKVVGNNVKKLDEFETEIKMWVFEEDINGRKLSEIINTDHENVKYLPGHKIPENVVCCNQCVTVVCFTDCWSVELNDLFSYLELDVFILCNKIHFYDLCLIEH